MAAHLVSLQICLDLYTERNPLLSSMFLRSELCTDAVHLQPTSTFSSDNTQHCSTNIKE